MTGSLSLLPSLVSLCSSLFFGHPPPAVALPPAAALQAQGPAASRPYNLIYHRPTGSCLLTSGGHSPPVLGPCARSDYWDYTPQRILLIKGSYFCLQRPAVPGHPARLNIACYVEDSQWDQVPGPSGEPRLESGEGAARLCLDVGLDGSSVVGNPCARGGEGQWFEILTAGKDGMIVGGVDGP